MKPLLRTRLSFGLLMAVALVLPGCVTAMNRTARVLEPGHRMVSGEVALGKRLENLGGDGIGAGGITARVGVARRLDVGIGHSWDLTEGGTLDTFWSEVGIQLSNADNEPGRAAFGLVVGKGYNYGTERHISGLTVIWSEETESRVTPYLAIRGELMGSEFVPDGLHGERYTVAMGLQIREKRNGVGRARPVVTVGAGWLSNVGGGEGGAVGFLNGGLGIEW